MVLMMMMMMVMTMIRGMMMVNDACYFLLFSYLPFSPLISHLKQM